MVSGIIMVNAATIYTFINFTYTFSVRDCNPNIYNASIHRIYGNSVKNYQNVLYFATAVAVLMKVVSIFSYYYALKKYMKFKENSHLFLISLFTCLCPTGLCAPLITYNHNQCAPENNLIG